MELAKYSLKDEINGREKEKNISINWKHSNIFIDDKRPPHFEKNIQHRDIEPSNILFINNWCLNDFF